MTDLTGTNKKALAYLASVQTDNGSFISYTSSTQSDFTAADELPAVFLSILILQCLNNTKNSGPITKKLAEYILQNKSSDWTWNYIERSKINKSKWQYPDDLDDTACALAALNNFDKELIDGTAVGKFAQVLIKSETRPGGPYITWLTDTARLPVWQDVDLVVNSNIAWFLKDKGVKLDPLYEYVDDRIMKGRLSSSYYPDRFAVIYFLSRWYEGKNKTELKSLLIKEIDLLNPTASSLQLAQLLSSGVNFELPRSTLEPLAERLVSSQNRLGYWEAYGLFYDPTKKKTKYYGGSKSLTTAFVLEALTSYEAQLPTLNKRPTRQNLKLPLDLNKDIEFIKYNRLKSSYRAALKSVIIQDKGRQITNMAGLTAAACQQKLDSYVITHLNLASLNGWLAYNIFDDILDNEARPEQLSIATYASRCMQRHFQQSLPTHPEFIDYLEDCLTKMDEANQWETLEARAIVNKAVVTVHKLPNYGSLMTLWQRSWGHSLAAAAVLLKLGYDLDSKDQLQLQRFFRHFLIARQLNDDAHDWENDLASGHLSAVVTLLLESFYPQVRSLRINTSSVTGQLKLHFWNNTIIDIDGLIQRHINIAKKAILNCSAIKNPEIFISWLESLSNASNLAIQQKTQVEKFISGYTD